MLITAEQARLVACCKFDQNCISNQCMAWRWSRAKEHGPDPAGYCGLAGLPKEELLTVVNDGIRDVGEMFS